MICTAGTSAVSSLPCVKALLKDYKTLTDEQIMLALLNKETETMMPDFRLLI